MLLHGLMGWDGDRDELTQALVWCRRRPNRVRSVFRHRSGWEMFLAGLREVLDERTPDSAPAPELDTYEAATLYQILYWIARAAAQPVPATDVVHVTAADVAPRDDQGGEECRSVQAGGARFNPAADGRGHHPVRAEAYEEADAHEHASEPAMNSRMFRSNGCRELDGNAKGEHQSGRDMRGRDSGLGREKGV